ncbi:hypothetical protein GCM10011571_32700 [Marinithermofilum abyssi]|uniref:Uncharacterized protein n=1 Tax=Marinithermofilum abyssi TaxID=1571185 RepID=A0A8J2YA03_9BACL|nr:hypothetical protein [Marinithermofilum abyssi]GGE28037.1 hypothetical protein GCM10011571_32700 [Marinithermofilum abyssi]
MNDRQKRFLWMYTPAAVILLAAWGAVVGVVSDDAPSEATSTPPSKAAAPAEESTEAQPPPAITEEDRKAAKQVALDFMQDYLTGAPLEQLQSHVTTGYYSQLEKEKQERPTVEKIQKIEATRVENWPLEQEGKVSWNVWVTVPRGKTGTYEVAYEVILAKTQDQWRVKAVTENEYPELRD